MRIRIYPRFSAFGLLAALSSAAGQSPTVGARQLPPAEVESRPGVVTSIAALRSTASGQVVIHDPAGQQVVLLDSTLTLRRVIADQTGSAQALYMMGGTAILAYRGDSTLLLNARSLSVAVLDQDGNVGRTMAPPRPSDFDRLFGGPAGIPGFDPRGRLIYRAAGLTTKERIRLGKLGPPAPRESTAVVRFDFASRRLDTAAFVRTYTQRIVPQSTKQGNTSMIWMTQILNPMPLVDEWAVLSDGTLAVVRGQDYHVDFFDAAGDRASGPKIPFAWRRMSDTDKVALIDSSKALRARLIADGIAVGHAVAPASGTEPLTSTSLQVKTGSASAASASPSASDPDEPPPQYVEPEELPDYQPVFENGGVRADADGRLWVRTIPPRPLAGGAIYDVIDRKGLLIDHVQVPRNSAIAGFGPAGAVYLAQRDARGLRLARVRYQPPRR
jgi:hypothetical protein